MKARQVGGGMRGDRGVGRLEVLADEIRWGQRSSGGLGFPRFVHGD